MPLYGDSLAKTVNEASILNNFQFTILKVAFERF